jgi:hypothetical protein
MFQALAAWQRAKESGDPRVPDHHVLIRAAAGTSAGGIAAALIGMLPFVGHHPITDLAQATSASSPVNAGRNLLYRSWVRDIDIRGLLDTSDINAADGHVPSLLNGQAVSRIADEAVATVREALLRPKPPPAFIANPLQLFICFTNMQGVPYLIRMTSICGVRGHWVTSHAGCAHFAVFGSGYGQPRDRPPGAIVVNSPDTVGFPELDGWRWVRDAALASSAFPGGLPARPFRHRRAVREGEHWFGLGTLPIPESAVDISPMLSLATATESPEFWCVDGGLINNEPLEYVRNALNASRPPHPGRDARNADRSFILIDPFPADESQFLNPVSEAPDMLSSVISLLPILRAHAQFKPRQVLDALDEDIRTRCLIAPARDGKPGGESNLASSGLAGFAGFLHEQFRMHDFQLGRINCQRFLRDHFFVHIDNPIMRPWVERVRGQPELLRPYHPQIQCRDGSWLPGDQFIQIVPLVETVRPELPSRPWPKLSRQDYLRPLTPMIAARTNAIVPSTVRGLLTRLGITDRRLIGRIIRSVASDVITSKVTEAITNSIHRDLSSRGLA